MAKYKVYASVNIDDEEIELDDDLSEEEIAREVFEYVNNQLECGYRKVD